MSIAEFLGLHKKTHEHSGTSPESETVRKIVAALDQMDPDKARYIASFAFILCRVARADLNITQPELRAIERILMERGSLTEEQAILATQMAKTQSIFFGGTENFLVTREFNRIATREQKLALLDCLFSVSAVDQISSIEETEISKICSELQLSHDDYISTLSAYREYRAVLKKPAQPAS
ncbi:MAG TPA: TerB family tellurite resistance protein [Candidatus Dormibacteraeota bacterium]|nr:TerB family tellurite resistance protein [Candidatus Dormibacteraeota bacterium]